MVLGALTTVVQGPNAAEAQLRQERLKRASLQSKCKNTMHAVTAPGRNSFIGGCPVTTLAGWQCNCTTCYVSNKSSWTTRAGHIVIVSVVFILHSSSQTIESVAMCHLYILYKAMIQYFFAAWQCNCTTCYLSNKSSWTTRDGHIITVSVIFILPSESQTIESAAMCHFYILYDTDRGN